MKATRKTRADANRESLEASQHKQWERRRETKKGDRPRPEDLEAGGLVLEQALKLGFHAHQRKSDQRGVEALEWSDEIERELRSLWLDHYGVAWSNAVRDSLRRGWASAQQFRR